MLGPWGLAPTGSCHHLGRRARGGSRVPWPDGWRGLCSVQMSCPGPGEEWRKVHSGAGGRDGRGRRSKTVAQCFGRLPSHGMGYCSPANTAAPAQGCRRALDQEVMPARGPASQTVGVSLPRHILSLLPLVTWPIPSLLEDLGLQLTASPLCQLPSPPLTWVLVCPEALLTGILSPDHTSTFSSRSVEACRSPRALCDKIASPICAEPQKGRALIFQSLLPLFEPCGSPAQPSGGEGISLVSLQRPLN